MTLLSDNLVSASRMTASTPNLAERFGVNLEKLLLDRIEGAGLSPPSPRSFGIRSPSQGSGMRPTRFCSAPCSPSCRPPLPVFAASDVNFI